MLGEPAETAASSEAAGRAAVILAGLPESYRRILQLRFLDSCSVRDAATALGVTVAYTKVSQSFRADDADIAELRAAITLRAA